MRREERQDERRQGIPIGFLSQQVSGYPGVRWQKNQDRKTHKPLDEGTGSFPETSRGFWRVSFTYKGKFVSSVGSGYKDEETAARAHDDYVREHISSNGGFTFHGPRAEDGY